MLRALCHAGSGLEYMYSHNSTSTGQVPVGPNEVRPAPADAATHALHAQLPQRPRGPIPCIAAPLLVACGLCACLQSSCCRLFFPAHTNNSHHQPFPGQRRCLPACPLQTDPNLRPPAPARQLWRHPRHCAGRQRQLPQRHPALLPGLRRLPQQPRLPPGQPRRDACEH